MTAPISPPIHEQIIGRATQAYEAYKPTPELAGLLQLLDPDLPTAAALTRAGDWLSIDRSMRMMREGLPLLKALPFVGSYGRIEFLRRALDLDPTAAPVVYKLLPKYWPGSDPDDTDPRMLSLWKAAYRLRKKHIILDNMKRQLPDGQFLVVYRGQPIDSMPGISWSFSLQVARKFAHGANTRTWTDHGEIVTGSINRTNILAYLTERNEQEVICDPLDVVNPTRKVDIRQQPKREVKSIS